MKRWKLPLAVLLIVLIGLAVFYFANHRFKPELVKAVDPSIIPKKKRPLRPAARRSPQAKKMAEKTGAGDATAMKPHGCVKNIAFDEATGILRSEMDYDCDGTVDNCLVEVLNEYGEPIRTENYKNCGDAPSDCFETEYNEYGEGITISMDLDCDGRPEACTTIKRNDHGDVIERIIDNGCDGVLEKSMMNECKSYTYDANHLIVHEISDNCADEMRVCTDFTYDLDAGVRFETCDFDCDGTVDVCMAQVYVDGYPEPFTFTERNCDGTWAHCTVYEENSAMTRTLLGHDACAKQYEQLVKRNRE